MHMQVSRSHISVVACCLFLLFAIVAYVSRWFAYRLNCNAGPLILRENSRRMNTYDANISKRLAELVERKATVSDPDLIQVIRDMMDPPSKHIPKMSRVLEATPQSNEIDMLYAQKTNGFYIECGAFDGEQMSNTIFLELARQWTGLLVEMDPYFYSQLLAKSRNSWSINACLSPKPYVTQLKYKESQGGLGRLMSDEPVSSTDSQSATVACFPLHALLVAMNRTTVDYMSLDVEGYELDEVAHGASIGTEIDDVESP